MGDYDKRRYFIEKFICAWNGHDWKTLWHSRPDSATYDYTRCRRCGKDGWRVK